MCVTSVFFRWRRNGFRWKAQSDRYGTPFGKVAVPKKWMSSNNVTHFGREDHIWQSISVESHLYWLILAILNETGFCFFVFKTCLMSSSQQKIWCCTMMEVVEKSTETLYYINKQLKGLFVFWGGDQVAQLVERRTRDPKTRGLNPVWSTRKHCESCSES